MFIFYSPASDPMLLDSAAKLNVLHQQLESFLASALKEISISADTSLRQEPYKELLNGLRVKKTHGQIMLKLSQDRWLELTGSEAYLAEYVSHFHFQEVELDGHHHPDHANYMSSGSLNLIIEADSTWPEG
jgi:hypothetical protein